MTEGHDYKKFAILYVDDEEMSLKYFSRAFGGQFRILTAANAQDGYRLLEQHKDEIGLLMTDQRMPGEKGVALLEKARQLRPRIIRILATAFADMDAAIAAVNNGSIFKYVTKPWDPPQLEITLKRALELFMVRRERDQLLLEKMSVLHNMMIADRVVSLGLLAAGLSHHIRNSLVAVKTFLDLAPAKLREENIDLDALQNPDFWKDYYSSVQAQIAKITGMLRNLGAASEQPHFEFRDEVNLHGIVAQVAAELAQPLQQKGIALVNRVPVDLPSLRVDRPKFHRLFELLIKDEIVSLPVGSEVVIAAETSTEPKSGRAELSVTVADNGPGLPKESLRLLFDPFALRSDTPLEYGLNLMACYFIVHHHGGRIDAHSEEGKGTTFRLHLPLNSSGLHGAQDSAATLQKFIGNEELWQRLLTVE
ncbi:MAG TPA: hybrid sensor histidine kinase/response regulator [Methylomirabilota bacterium]|nr:hybrid sensor histidine kinase/response regulator [Methylomirabilota bacterium]